MPSVARALLDGPSLLLIAAAMALLPPASSSLASGWRSALVLVGAGLGRETNLLALAALPRSQRWRLIALAVLPTLAWAGWLEWRFGAGGLGARNFAWPLAGYAHNVVRTWRQLAGGNLAATAPRSAFVLIALTAQLLFFALRRRPRDPWWRLGAAYAALMVLVGDAVWEGYPAAVSRVLLPRWAGGPADLLVRNPQTFPLRAHITFAVKGLDDRGLTLADTGAGAGPPIWHGRITPRRQDIDLGVLVVPPGESLWRFDTDKPPTQKPGNKRSVTFSLRSLKFVLAGPALPETRPRQQP